MAVSRIRTLPEPPGLLCSRVAAALEAAAPAPGERLCVAFSGGVDSVVLLDLLDRLQAQFGYVLIAAHVNHGLSENASCWREFCRRLCERRRIPLHVFSVAVESRGSGVEAAAREARIAALRRVSADWLVFGHHQDDQAETLLFRLLRGAGVRGAAAMAPLEAGRPGVLRPLLQCRRVEIAEYAHLQGLDWVEDESNLDRSFSRNFLRHEVFPALTENFPAAVANLARAAEHFREGESLLCELAEADDAACGGDIWLASRLLALTDARLRNLLRWRIRRAGRQVPSSARLDELIRQLRRASGPLRCTLGSLVGVRYRGHVWLEPFDAGWRSPSPQVLRDWRDVVWAGGVVRFDQSIGEGVDARRLDCAAGDLTLEVRWPGLRMGIGAGRPRREFKKLCQAAGVPPWLRERLPVLCVAGEPVWIAGIGVSAHWGCPPDRPGVVPAWLPSAPGYA